MSVVKYTHTDSRKLFNDVIGKEKTLGEILYAARQKKNLTQNEVAEKIGVHANTYARNERDEQRPSVSTLEMLSDLLDLDLRVLTKAWRRVK